MIMFGYLDFFFFWTVPSIFWVVPLFVCVVFFFFFRADLTSDRYWRSPPDPLLSSSSLVEFVVLDCEPAEFSGGGGGGGGGKEWGATGSEVALWEVVVRLFVYLLR